MTKISDSGFDRVEKDVGDCFENLCEILETFDSQRTTVELTKGLTEGITTIVSKFTNMKSPPVSSLTLSALSGVLAQPQFSEKIKYWCYLKCGLVQRYFYLMYRNFFHMNIISV